MPTNPPGNHIPALMYEVACSRQTQDEWVVEAINYAGDGEIYAATFSGPLAKERAEEYAAWKSTHTSRATQ